MNTKILVALVIGIALVGLTCPASAAGYGFYEPDVGSYTPSSWVYGQHNPDTGVMSVDEYIPGFYTPPADGEAVDEYGFIKPDVGFFTVGVYTAIQFDMGTMTQLPNIYTPGFYTPPADEEETETLESIPMSGTTSVTDTKALPIMEERRVDEPEVPEAYSLREDLAGTDIPGVYIGRRLVP
jgi:hypothetical protein